MLDADGDVRHAASSRSRGWSSGSTAASSSASRGRSTTSAPAPCSSASPWSASPRAGELRGFRHDGFWDCMDTYKDAVVLNDLWATGAPPWRVWERARRAGSTRRMRRALVTGGRGFVGAWLCKALVERGVEVTSFDRRGPHERPSTLALLGIDGEGRGGARASSSRPRSCGRPLDRRGSRRRLPPRRGDDRRHRPGRSRRRLRDERARHLDAARGLPRRSAWSGSSSPPPTRPTAPTRSCPTARTSRSARRRPTRPRRRPPT